MTTINRNESASLRYPKLAGAPKTKQRIPYGQYKLAKFFSPIEVFIYQKDERKNKKLIKFIKGETKTIKF
jgi:hypothetical protein